MDRPYRRSAAFSFHSDLGFTEVAKLLNAREDWVGKPPFDGQWLCRDNDRWGDYLSFHEDYRGDERQTARIAIFFDDPSNYIEIKFESALPEIDEPWREHLSFALNHLLPALGARDVAASDFEK